MSDLVLVIVVSAFFLVRPGLLVVCDRLKVS